MTAERSSPAGTRQPARNDPRIAFLGILWVYLILGITVPRGRTGMLEDVRAGSLNQILWLFLRLLSLSQWNPVRIRL